MTEITNKNRIITWACVSCNGDMNKQSHLHISKRDGITFITCPHCKTQIAVKYPAI